MHELHPCRKLTVLNPEGTWQVEKKNWVALS